MQSAVFSVYHFELYIIDTLVLVTKGEVMYSGASHRMCHGL